MKCTNCGNEVPNTARVCGYCGHRLRVDIPAPVAPPMTEKQGLPGWIWWMMGGVVVAGVVVVLGIAVFVFMQLPKNNMPAESPTNNPVPFNNPTLAPPPTQAPTNVPAPSDTPFPSVTPQPKATPTLIILPQQWNGTYSQSGIGKLNIIIIIEKIKGDSFSGKMFWKSTDRFRGAVTWISGEFVTDFGDVEEQAKWGNVADYRDGERNGTWIKWTETGFADGGGYTLGGWYYGHIRENGTTMVGIYYLNDKITSFTSSDSWELKKK